MLSMLPLRLAVVPASCNFFQKFVQSLQSPTFIRKFLKKFFFAFTTLEFLRCGIEKKMGVILRCKLATHNE